jgi:hypothetical protein
LIGTGPTGGVTVNNGETAVIAWDGADFVRISALGGPITGSTGTFTGNVSGVNGTFTGNVQVPSLNGSCLAGLRNRIINGNYSVNQRAVSGTVTLAAGAYGHDRWKAGASGCSYVFTTTANVTTLNIASGTLQQVIEGNNLETGTYCLSWTGTATAKIGAGSLSASGVTGAVTGGTDTTIEFSTGTVSKVQFENSPVPTIFEQRPYGLELLLCQRYYYRIVAGTSTGILGNAFVQTGSTYKTVGHFPTPLRIVPTSAGFQTTAAAADYSVVIGASTVVNTVLPTFNTRTNQYMYFVDNTTAVVFGTAGFAGVAVTSSSATTFLGWSAEL